MKQKALINSAFLIGGAVLIESCGSRGGSRSNAEGIAKSVFPAGPMANKILTEKEVDELARIATKRGNQLTSDEISELAAAANRGALSAYYVLYYHYDLGDDPENARRWFDEGLAKGEPNILTFQASREEVQASNEKDKAKKVELLMRSRAHFRDALRRGSSLWVGTPETVRSDLDNVEKLQNAQHEK